jgi:hypothetical protein
MKLAYMGWRHRLTPRKSREQATTSPSPAINFAIRRPPYTHKNVSQKLPDYLQTKQNVKKKKNQCCGSGMFIPDPGSKNSKIEKGEKKIFVLPFFVATNITKIKNYLFWPIFTKNYRTFYSKICHPALKNMGLGSGIRDRGSGKNIFRTPGPKRHRIRNTEKN